MAEIINDKTLNKIIKDSSRNGHIKLTNILNKIKKNDLELLGKLGSYFMANGKFDMASRIYAKWTDFEPNSPYPWCNLGASLYRERKSDEAKDVLEYAVSLDPKFITARINLGGVYQELGLNKEGLENALEAIKLNPIDPLSHNNLGSALADLGMASEAKEAFETALVLDPNHEQGLMNLGKMCSNLGDTKQAIKHFEKIKNIQENLKSNHLDLTKLNLSLEYFKIGKLEKGWKGYEKAFSPKVPYIMSRHPQRLFVVLRWDGRKLKNHEKLLVWREQGIGDEVMFSTMLHELSHYGKQIILECESRLVSIYRRSFPNFIVREQTFQLGSMTPTVLDYHYHLPIASLGGFYRNNIDDFKKSKPFIKIDAKKDFEFKERLKLFEGKKKIGICWRSGNLKATRNNSYTSLVDWNEIFKMKDAVFVNLQYGECETEILEAEKKFGINIIRWADIDLKNDLESVFALIKNLDTVISVGTAVVPFSGALGIKTYLTAHKNWSLFGTEGKHPWFSSVETVIIKNNLAVAHGIPIIAKKLNANKEN